MIEPTLPIKGNALRLLAANALVASAYILSGKIGLLLALPPGYASAIFPAAGIAVAAALIGGARLLPGVFLGSLLLNLWVGQTAGQSLSAVGAATATIIALASLLQAAAGGWFLRRAIGYPAPLDSGRDIRNFALAAPAICLISASISVAGLLVLGIFERSDYATNWVVWWLGDTIGVLVLLPIAMVIAGKPRALWRKRALSVALPMLLSFAVFVAIYIRVNGWEREESLQEFRAASERLVVQVQAELDTQIVILEQLERLFSRAQRVTRQEYRDFVQRTLARYPNVQALSWDPLVSLAQRPSHEQGQRSEVAGFEIRELTASGALVRAGERDEYFPITYIEPRSRNEESLGYDLASSPERRKTIVEAFNRKLAIVTPPLKLVQERSTQAGLLVIMPVFDAGARKGIVASALRVGDFLDKLLAPVRAKLLMRVLDVETGKKLYDSFPGASGGMQQAAFQETIRVGARDFRLETSPTPVYLSAHRGWQSWAVLTAGLLGTSLLGALLMLGSGRAARVEALIVDRTGALGDSEAFLSGLFTENPDAMLVVGSSGIIVRANSQAELVFGYSRGALVGRTVNQLLPERVRARHGAHIASFFAHPRRRPMGAGLPLSGLRADGTEFPVDILLSPLRSRDGDLAIAIVRDITERQEIEEELQESREQFRAVAATANDAIVSADAQGRIIYMNHAAEALFGHAAGEALGLPLTTLMPEAYRAAHLAGFQEYLASGKARIIGRPLELNAKKTSGEEFPIELSIADWTTARGHFFTAILRDITERKQQQTLIASSLAEKETLLREVYHRVKNNLQVLSSLFNLQARALPEGASRNAIRDGADRVYAMALVHEKLYRSERLSSIQLADYIGDLCGHLTDASGSERRDVRLDWDVEPIELGLDTAIPLGLLLNELVSNSLKHAFHGTGGGQVHVGVRRAQGGEAIMVVSDSGAGFPAGLVPEAGSSLGMKLIVTLAAQIGGSVSFESGQGLRVTVKFKISRDEAGEDVRMKNPVRQG